MSERDEKLRVLIEQWRRKVTEPGSYGVGAGLDINVASAAMMATMLAYKTCADQLEKVLNEERVSYRSGTSDVLGLGWDVMQVIQSREDAGVMRIANSFTIARDESGAIMQKTDSLPERWEMVTNPDDYRGFQAYFDERDKLAEKKKAVSAEGEVS